MAARSTLISTLRTRPLRWQFNETAGSSSPVGLRTPTPRRVTSRSLATTRTGVSTTFDGDGRTTIDFGAREFAYDLAVQSDAKLVVVGQSTLPPTGNDFALARLNTDGSLDTQGLDRYLDAPFGTGGKVLTSFGDDDIAKSVEIEPGGKILVAGLASPEGTDGDFGLVRYNVDGSVDSSFGTAGKVTTAMTTGEDVPWGVVVQRDGRIVVAGGSQGSGSDDFLLARYQVRGCCFIDGSPPGGPPDPGPLP